MMNILGLIGRMIYNYKVNIYVFSLKFEGEKKNKEKVEFLQEFVKKFKIIESELYTSYSEGLTYYIMATHKHNLFFIPLYYQVYAYIKTKKKENFTFSHKTLIFKNITILKFKIQCYGKK